MDSLWEKIKFWTRVTILSLLGLYVVVFVFENASNPATFWWWYKREKETTAFVLAAIAFAAGIVTTIVTWTLLRTLGRFRAMSRAARTDRLEQEVAQMKAKAAMLQTRPVAGTTTPPTPL